METLLRIKSLFENVRSAIKSKKSDRILQIKNDIRVLSCELEVLGKENQDAFVRSLAMEGYLVILMVKTMPLTISEKNSMLQNIYDKLKVHALRNECLFIFLRVQNLLCYYLIQLDQTTQAQAILEHMEELYEHINKVKANKYLDAEDLFTSKPLSELKYVHPEKIDKVITNNVQMQAFLYNKLNIPEKYTLYNHTALRRQLEMKEGTPQDWAVRTARLGNYFTYLNQVGNARHHLCAAYHVLRTCHDNCKLMPEEFVHQKSDFELHFLELSHYWVKYGLTLFKLSKKKVLSKYFSRPSSKADLWKSVDMRSKSFTEEREINKACVEKLSEGDFNPNKLYEFPSLDLKEKETNVPMDIVSKIEDARKLFAFTHKWLIRAKSYYDIEHNPAQFISCSLQLAELYEHLAFFERNVDSQYILQKRRADVLETLSCLLKTCDNTTNIQIDVIRELSQVQLELMALNLQKLWREESQTNLVNLDNDADSIIHSLDSESNKTITEKTLNASSKNMFLRKMEATTSLNGRLFRLSGHLSAGPPSQISFGSEINNRSVGSGLNISKRI